MLNWIRPRLLRLLRVPHDPEPPAGAPGSIRVFRAGSRFYYVKLIAWLIAQVGAAIGIAFSVAFLAGLRSEYNETQERKAQRAQAAAVQAAEPKAPAPTTDAPAAPEAAAAEVVPEKIETKTKLPREMRSKRNRERAKQAFLERFPPWSLTAMELAELAGIAFFLVQLPFTFAAVRLDWELRWYIVTDRSLRIRAGLWSLQESTMSFANLQQVEVRQGPLQRLLGIADVRVQSAGGGGGGHKGHEQHDSLHTGVFHGVDNAHVIRDLILERLRYFREAGLGDPDDRHAAPEMLASVATPESIDGEKRPSDALAAARELLEEARALRRVVT